MNQLITHLYCDLTSTLNKELDYCLLGAAINMIGTQTAK